MKYIWSKKTDKKGSKDWRKPWEGKRKSANVDSSCRCHGGCDYCYTNRTYSDRKARKEAEDHIKDYSE